MKWLDELKEHRTEAERMSRVLDLEPWVYSIELTAFDRLIEIAERAEWGGITVELGQNPSMSVNNVCPICFVRVGEEHGRYKKSEFEADYMITPEGKLVPTGKLCPYSDEWELTKNE